MTKKLLKSMLVAAGMVMGLNVAQAESIEATLMHTASSSCGGDAAAYTSTVDAEKEHVNNAGFNATWQGAAYAEFALAIPKGFGVQKATLSYTCIGESRRDRDCDIYYANVGEALDYDEMAAGAAKVNLDATWIVKTSFPKYTDDTPSELQSKDVTLAVQSIVASGQSYIIFKWTGNPGGGDIYGMASTQSPTLVLDLVDASTLTTYTIKFTDGAQELKDAKVFSGNIGDEVTYSDDLTADFTKDGIKYTFTGASANSIVLDADPEKNVIELYFEEAPKFSYSLVNNIDYTTVASGSDYQGEVAVPFPKYYQIGNKLYEAAQEQTNEKDYFRYHIQLDYDQYSGVVSYEKAVIEDVVFYSEIEDLEGMNKSADGNANIRCSNGALGYNGDEDIKVTTLPAGNYKIMTVAWGNSGTTITIQCGENELACETLGYLAPYEMDVKLTSATDVIIKAGGASTKGLDYIIIQEVPETYSFTLKSDRGTIIKEGTGYAGTVVAVAYPRFEWDKDKEQLFEARAITEEGSVGWYKYQFELVEDGQVVEIPYDLKLFEGVVFYAEAENVEGLSVSSKANGDIRCSNAAGAWNASDAEVTLAEVPEDEYVLTTSFWGSTGQTLTINCGGTAFSNETTGSLTQVSTQPMTFSTVTLPKSGDSQRYFDLFFIQKASYAIIKGDVNGDGKVNVGDIMAVINVMAGQGGEAEKAAADLNGDGSVNVGDIMAVINIMAGIK